MANKPLVRIARKDLVKRLGGERNSFERLVPAMTNRLRKEGREFNGCDATDFFEELLREFMDFLGESLDRNLEQKMAELGPGKYLTFGQNPVPGIGSIYEITGIGYLGGKFTLGIMAGDLPLPDDFELQRMRDITQNQYENVRAFYRRLAECGYNRGDPFEGETPPNADKKGLVFSRGTTLDTVYMKNNFDSALGVFHGMKRVLFGQEVLLRQGDLVSLNAVTFNYFHTISDSLLRI